MNISKAVSHLKMMFGLYAVTLPFKDQDDKPIPTERFINDVITTMTIPIYSRFVPWKRFGDIPFNQLEVVDEDEGIYKIPVILTITPIMYVHSVEMAKNSNAGPYGYSFPSYGISHAAQGVITSQAHNMLAGQLRAEPTFEDLGYNKIQLRGYPRTKLTIRVACEHLPNGESIPESCYKSFLELASLDLKVVLYNNLKLYDGQATAHGTINLKIDDYQGAESERTQLLKEWEEVFHLDMGWETFM